MTIAICIVAMVVLSIIIAKACDAFEVATDFLGRNMSEGVKGATLNAIGSSMPEFLTTVFFLAFASHTNLGYNLAASIGGDTGSAIFNSIVIPMMVIGVVIWIVKLSGAKVSRKVILRDGLFLIAAELLLLVLLSSDTITHWHGWTFTIFYLIYLGYTLLSMKKAEKTDVSDEEEDEELDKYGRFIFRKEDYQSGRAWLVLSISITFIAAACAGLVHAAEVMSEALDINMLFVSLVLIAAASSVPDTIISIRDARKGNHDDALSNVLGSNIFDITISMGLPLAVYLLLTGQSIDFTTAGPTLIDIRVVLLLVTVITIGVFYFSKTLGKTTVVILGLLYAVFILYAVGAAQYHAGSETFLADIAGSFIEYLRAENGLGTVLQKIANAVTGNW